MIEALCVVVAIYVGYCFGVLRKEEFYLKKMIREFKCSGYHGGIRLVDKEGREECELHIKRICTEQLITNGEDKGTTKWLEVVRAN